MKGVYLTSEAKKEIEKELKRLKGYDIGNNMYLDIQIETYENILKDSIVLPVHSTWNDLGHDTGTFLNDDGDLLGEYFPNGIIVSQPQ